MSGGGCLWRNKKVKGKNSILHFPLTTALEVYVKGSAEAVHTYQRAFEAEILGLYPDGNGGFLNRPVLKMGGFDTPILQEETAVQFEPPLKYSVHSKKVC